MTSIVYFIKNASGLVKIGWTSDIDRRVKFIARAEQSELEVLATIPGGANLERKLHIRFAADRIRGEWFTLSPDIKGFIAECLSGSFEDQKLARLPLATLLSADVKSITADDTLAIVRTLLEEFVSYYETDLQRMPAIDATAAELKVGSEWVRKCIAGTGARSIAADTFFNIIAQYLILQDRIQLEAAEKQRLAASRQADAKRVLDVFFRQFDPAIRPADALVMPGCDGPDFNPSL